MKRFSILMAVLILALVLVACGGAEGETVEVTRIVEVTRVVESGGGGEVASELHGSLVVVGWGLGLGPGVGSWLGSCVAGRASCSRHPPPYCTSMVSALMNGRMR